MKTLCKLIDKQPKGTKETKKQFIIYIFNKYLLSNYWHKIDKKSSTHEASWRQQTTNITLNLCTIVY